MTLADKYNEAMEHLQLTTETRERILHNVSKSMEAKGRADKAAKLIRFPSWKRWGALAACLAVVVIGAIIWKPGQVTPNNDDPQTMLQAGIEECASAEELSKAVGFPVEDISDLPITIQEIYYDNYFDSIAQITVQSDNRQICFRKAVGMEDISGDYNEYSVTKEEDLNGVVLALKGNGNLFSLAVWQDAGYTYSLSMEPPASAEAIKAVVDSIIKQ